MKLLIDFNSIYKRFFFSKYYVKNNEKLEDKNFNFEDFYTNILSSLNIYRYKFNIDRTDIILVFDRKLDNNYWRNRYYPPYKHKKTKMNENMIELSKMYNKIVNDLKKNIFSELYSIMELDNLEADDVIAILSRSIRGDVVIVSHDKDMKQLINNSVNIYNPAEDKIYNRFDKNDLIKHIISGDDSDNIPSIFRNTVFTDDFIKFLNSNGITDDNVYRVEQLKIFPKLEEEYLEKSEKNSIYKRSQYRLGKKIDTHLDQILDMIKEDKLLKKHYIRNKLLIDLSMIPKEYQDRVNKLYNNRDIKGLNRININNIMNGIKRLQLVDINSYDLI